MNADASIRPGDVIDVPLGVKSEIDRVVVHGVNAYPSGALSIRFRYLSNPRGIDWSGFIEASEPQVRVVSRGVCRVDASTRNMLP